MTRPIVPLLVVLGIVCCTCAWAQNDTGSAPDNTPPVLQPGPQPAFTYPDTTPSLDFLTGSVENSSITLGISAGFAYDSNGYAATSGSQGRWFFNVAPSVRIQQFLPKFAWHAGYTGGLQTYNQANGSSSGYTNLFSQSANGGFIWQFARHWQMLASESYRYSADPFQSYLTIPGAPTANNPNAVSYYPLTQYTLNTAILTLTNQLSQRDTLSFTGTENYQHTSTYNLVTSVPFYNLISYGGRVAYSHQLSPRLSLGGGYNYNSLDFGTGQQRSGIQTIEFTADYLIRPNMTIAGWVGPQYTSTKTVVPFVIPSFPPQVIYFTNYSTQWSTAVGANFGWRSKRNSVRAGFSRGVSNGGGITATSQVNQVNASYSRLITYKLSGVLGARYTNSTSTTANSRSFSNTLASAGLSYQIAKSLSASANYSYVHQTQSNAFLINSGTYNDNRVGVSISYYWSHPLGR